MNLLLYALKGIEYGTRIAKVKLTGFHRFRGDADDIVRQAVHACWNGRYLQASSGHFTEFWIRDFGLALEGLLQAGMQREAEESLNFALKHYLKAHRVCTAVTKQGIAYDYPAYSPDSLPHLLRAIRLVKARGLLETYRSFLNREVRYYYETVFDRETLLVKKDRHFSSIRDFALRQSSCYDNSMLLMLQKELSHTDLDNPLRKFDITANFIKEFWQGTYFYDDITRNPRVSGDANVFPFWTGAVGDTQMLKAAIGSIRKAGLDQPFPLKYNDSGEHSPGMNWLSIIVPNYETSTVWTNIGLAYIDLVQQVDTCLCKKYMEAYNRIIEANRTALELFYSNGKPFKTPFYESDEGMLWYGQHVKINSAKSIG